MSVRQKATEIPAVKASPAKTSAIKPNYGKAIGFVAGGIGDQIYHLTQLRALARASTDGKIDIACIHPGPISKILAGTKWVNSIIDARPLRRFNPFRHALGTAPATDPNAIETDAISQLQQAHYDTAFFMHRSTSFKLAARAAGIKTRIGLKGSLLDGLLLQISLDLKAGGDRRSVWGHRPFIAAIDEYITTMGLALDTESPTIAPTKDGLAAASKMISPGQPTFIINLYALDPARRWPVASAIDVIMALAEQTGGQFLLNAGPDAAAYHDEVMAAWQRSVNGNVVLAKNQLQDCLRLAPSMEKDVALYHLADYYIGVDSFTANLAMNCSLPALVLFAKTGDILRYRSRVEAIAAPVEGQIGSITTPSIMAAFARLA